MTAEKLQHGQSVITPVNLVGFDIQLNHPGAGFSIIKNLQLAIAYPGWIVLTVGSRVLEADFTGLIADYGHEVCISR